MVCLEEQAQDAGLQTSAAADPCNLLHVEMDSRNGRQYICKLIHNSKFHYQQSLQVEPSS
jgi:hypothetical protein